MATLWIREYRDVGVAVRPAPIPTEPGTDQTSVTFTTSAQSAAFATGTVCIGFIANAAFHYVVGANPTATTGALKVPADTLVHVAVTVGHKIAAIAAA